MLVKEIKPTAFTIAEDMSGMPGLAAPVKEYGTGFDYRMSMGVADHWIKWIKEVSDENWNVCNMWYELTNKRADEKTISYAECHDQAMVGDKTIIFRLMDKEMYTSMNLGSQNIIVDRGIALHKMIRLLTIATSGNGYLTFMGNEFGHPEWIDFPREGNDWSYQYARRQWSLSESPFLRYGCLMKFEKEMIGLFKKKKILSKEPVSVYNDEQKQILVLKRNGYLFVFNFSPTNSYDSYLVDADPGKYKVVLDTDWKEFNGFERNSRKTAHFTIYSEAGNKLSLYLPSRSAFVLKHLK
jgi:1,4-alpha-glucan branching enzyme